MINFQIVGIVYSDFFSGTIWTIQIILTFIFVACNRLHNREAFAISPVKKWCKSFAEGKTSLYDDPSCGRPLTNDLAESISSVLKERPCLSCRVSAGTYSLERGLA
jgi:hypothetical protein